MTDPGSAWIRFAPPPLPPERIPVQGGATAEGVAGLGRAVDDLPVSIDKNAYIDMFGRRATDAERVALRGPHTRAVLGGREVYVPPQVLDELTRGGDWTAKEVFENLRSVAGRVGQGPEGHPNTVKALMDAAIKRGDPRVGASGFELGGDIALGDKRLAKALVRTLGYPRDQIISLRPEVWQPWNLAILASLLGLGATSNSSRPQPVVTPEHQ